MKRILSFLLIVAATAVVGPRALAQNLTYAEKVQRYIATYKDLAMQEQQRSGIPAAITLAQGILESGAGESELAMNAGNHFGIKCKKDWTGETYNHDDDAPDECFRKYTSAEASYRDHSDFLKNAGRYQPCFAQSTTDYAAWAYQLKTCGYATSSTYAQRLIKIIEDYKLQQYTYAALDNQNPLRALDESRTAVAGEVVPERDAPLQAAPTTAEPVRVGEKPAISTAPSTEASRLSAHSETPEEARVRAQQARASNETATAVAADGTTMKDGRRGFYARKGDVLLEDAIRHRIRYAKLLEINGLPDEPLSTDRFIYLEKATTTRIEHDVAAIASHDETARVASSAPLRGEAAPAATMVASTAGMVPEPKQKAAEISAPAVEEVRSESQPVTSDAAVVSEKSAIEESTQDTVAPAPGEVEERASEVAATVENNISETTTETARQATAGEPERTTDVALATQESPVVNARFEEPVAASTENAASSIAPSTDAASTTANAAPADAFNIAGESAVEEGATGEDEQAKVVKPVAEPEEPKDEMSRLKARFDKAVYAPAKPRPVQESAPASTAVASTNSKAVDATKAAPVAASSKSGAKYYTVQKGDTAFGIAKKHGITVRQLQEWNGLSMDAGVPLGKKLKVQP